MSNEWSILESIHPTICIANKDAIATLRVPVELPRDTTIRILHVPHDLPGPTNTDPLSVSLSVLPPLDLCLCLPPLYPSQSPPIIQSLHAAFAWLTPSTLALVKDHLNTMWSPGDDSGVLYSWVEWIRTGDFLADIGLLVGDDTHSIQIPHPSPQQLLALLLAHASSAKSDQFAQTSYMCTICLSERKGVHCLALSCGHVFCRTCLVDMWGLHVKEGQVSHVGCPEPGCGKTDEEGPHGLREATEGEVRAVLSENELDRWKWLCKKRDLERDPATVYCPMEYCQEPVPNPDFATSSTGTSDGDEASWAHLRTCRACGYSFCAFCKRTWHGPHTPCPVPLTSILEYLTAPHDSPKRRAIERRYGYSNVRRLARRRREEQKNKKWMKSSTTACPGCQISIEKSSGCNHMTCSKCCTAFCYRCGTKLSSANPYKHFSMAGTACFQQLFSEDE